MKLHTLVAVGFLCSAGTSLYAQKSEIIRADMTIPVEYHGETEALLNFVEDPKAKNEQTKFEKIGYHPKQDWVLNPSVNPNALPNGWDKAHQKNYANGTQKALTQNWEGMGNTGVSPADPSVDVGPGHVVQMINGGSGSYIQVYNKTGGTIGGQVYFDNFMGMPGGAGDPIVLYDERADRWLLSEFSQTGNNMHVAISTTPDPTGTYHTYSFNAPSFPDYPKYSIWNDAYIITTNENQSSIYALNRTDLLAGTASAAQRFTMTNFGTIGFQAATPVSLNGTTNAPAGTPNLLMRMRDDSWTGATSDALEIWELDINWANQAMSTLIQVQVLGITPHESELCGYTSFACIPQPGTGTTLDPLRELLMNRIHYRNFGTHESIVCCHVTDVNGNDRAGIRWYELRRTNGTSGSWSIYQESTYSPDADNRWMPSIGISATGNIGLAYNVSSNSVFPSLRYTGRKECDPLNSMSITETTIVAGTASNNSNRYGDYNAMGLDPSDGETFYFTGMYNPATQWSTRIAAFDIPTCTPQVSFGGSAYTVDEPMANVNNNCLDYYILNVPISIGSDPSQPANVMVNVSGGSATQNVDYFVNTNTFTFDGSILSGNVEIWVYNDDYVEGTETITLDYTLNANGGDAGTGTINQTVTVTINDDDLAPGAMMTTTTILQDDFDDGTLAPFTTTNSSGDTPWQVGDNAAAASGAFAVPTSNTSLFAWINDDDCDCDQSDVDLTFPTIDLTNYTNATLTFRSYFESNTYQGNTEEAEVRISVNGGAEQLVGPLVASQIDVDWVDQTFDLTPYVGNANVQLIINYNDGSGWLYGCTVDDVLVTGTAPVAIQTNVNTGTGMEAYLGPNETVHFYDPGTSNVMMSITNTSSHDYGCTTVDVDRDGSTPTALEFASANTADYLHSKSYTVVPANANPSGTFDVTLYYEEAEVAAWETFTGASRNNAEIIKVLGNNRINDVTPGNYGSYTIDNVAATLGSFGSDVTFTASFSNGFSGFGVGIYNVSSGVAPSAAFSSNTVTICEGATVNFTDQSTGSPTGWSWNFGDANTSTGQNPSNTYTSPGNYTVTLTATNAFGNDTETSTNYITVLPASSSSQSLSICPGSSVTVGTSTYTAAGNYTDVLTASNGCDSTVSTTISMLAPSSNAQSFQICPGSSVTVGSSTYNSAGTYTDVLSNSVGCDSTITTTVSMLNAPSYSQTLSICPGGSVTVGTSTYNSAGTYTDVLNASNGCDSTVTTTVNMNNASTFSQTLSICPGGSVTVGSSTYTSAGTYTDVLTNSVGCDSTITTTVNVGGATNSSQSVSFCPGGSVTVGTNTYSTAGTYTDVLTGSNGCDSTVVTTVSVLSTASYSQTLNICPGGSVTVGSNTYSTAGTYTDVLTGGNGCDSTVTTTVNLLAASNNTQNVQLCNGSSITVGSSTYNAAGSYTDVLTNAVGCDSTVITNITIVTTINNAQTSNLCPGGSVTVGTNTYTAAGTYVDTLTASAGCDSVVTTTVNLNSANNVQQTATICQGESVTVGSSTYTSAGVYTDVLTNMAGCDSTVETTVVVNQLPTVYFEPNLPDTLCDDGALLPLVGAPLGGTFSGTGVSGSNFDPSAAGAGNHDVTYTFTDGNGCVGSATSTVTVVSCTGIFSEGLENVKLFPNPNTGNFMVTGLENGTICEIYDDRGRLVVRQIVTTDPMEVNLPASAGTGTYFLRTNKEGQTGSIQFVVTR